MNVSQAWHGLLPDKLGFISFLCQGKTYLPGFDLPDSPGCTVDLPPNSSSSSDLPIEHNMTWLPQGPELYLWHTSQIGMKASNIVNKQRVVGL